MKITDLTPYDRHLLLAYRDRLLKEHLPGFISQAFSTVNPGTDYLPNWHIDLIADYLEAVRRSEITRLIVNMPPRALKSVCVSVAWPAWLLGHDPACRIMCASYSQALAIRHALDTRLILGEPWYERLFPDTRIVPGENEKKKIVTTARGFRFATSVGGTATGEGGDVLIVDDPLNPVQAASATQRERANQWFDQTFSTRLNDKKRGRIVVVMQRLHAQDLSGHLLEQGGWEQLLLPAIAERRTVIGCGGKKFTRREGSILHPEREDAQALERARQQLGSYGFAAQYQQSPLAAEGAMIQAQWLVRYRDAPQDFTRITQSWDTAIKAASSNDASVCITFGEREGMHYVLDVLSLRAEYPALKRALVAQAARWQPQAVLVEDKASGQSLLQDARRETNLPLIARLPRQDKLTRVAACSAMIEAGKLALPHHAPWLAAFEEELLAFPNAAHDDQVDALSQYLLWVRERGGMSASLRTL